MVLNIVINSLLVIHVIVALLLILVVLMQRPKNEGLGAAFGGGMTENLFGAQTTNVLQTFTRNLGIIFFLLAVVLSVLYAMQSSASSEVERRLRDKPAPTATEKAPANEKSAAAAEVAPNTESETVANENDKTGSQESEKSAPEAEASSSARDVEPVAKELDEAPAKPETTPAAGGE